MSLRNKIYYKLKPFIPRRLQIEIRRQIILPKRAKYSHIWPIDESAGKPPEGWKGWPDGKKFALVLTHDVEAAEGRDKCLKLAELEMNLGFRSTFNFVAEDYEVPAEIFDYLRSRGFEVGVHGLSHKGNLFASKEKFKEQAVRINQYLKKWGAVGFRTPSMFHNLDWIHDLDIAYDSSTFDADPFEPQPDGAGTIFPFWVPGNNGQKGYVELPSTLPQDHSLFVIMGEKNIDIWKKKLDWIAEHGGMALLITHPDYMNFEEKKDGIGEYPLTYFTEFLEYIKNEYKDQYWNALPKEMARFWAKIFQNKKI
jgi:peptidoglycan/xylan/chitin deacetylase (PgdA/CDA1 family)